MTGGVPTLLSAARAGLGATWSRDGTIVFGGGPGGGLARVSASGGEPFVLASPLEGSRICATGGQTSCPTAAASSTRP